MQSSFSETQLDRRAATIIRSVRVGQVPPNSDALAELAELTEVLSDQPVKPVVIARMTVTRANGAKTIVEIWANATFHSFYHFFKQQGARRSTKEPIRTAYRDEGVNVVCARYNQQPGLDVIAKRLEMYASQGNTVVSTKIRIIRKRAYRKLINATPHELGLTKMARLPIYSPVHS
jgi:hypothetical protein